MSRKKQRFQIPKSPEEVLKRIMNDFSSHNRRSTDDNKLLLSDFDHWSYNRVVFYRKRLYEYGFLDLIKNN